MISVLYSRIQSRKNTVNESLLIRIQSKYKFKNHKNRLQKMNNPITPAIRLIYNKS